MSAFTDHFNYWISSEFFAVGLFAFLGVAIRVGIQNAFQTTAVASSSTTGYEVFTNIFYSETYLAANFLGCFIMSICISFTKPISNVSLALYKGLSTGLCGCITTFSTWMNVAVGVVFVNRTWYEISIMIVLEFWLTWSAFVFGFTFSKLLQELWIFAHPPNNAVDLTQSDVKATENPMTASRSDVEASGAANGTAGMEDILTEGSPKSRNTSQRLTFADRSSKSGNGSSKRMSTSGVLGGTTHMRGSMIRGSMTRGSVQQGGAGTRGSTAWRGTMGEMGGMGIDFDDEGEDEVLLDHVAGRVSVWREDGPDAGPSPFSFAARARQTDFGGGVGAGAETRGGGSVKSGHREMELRANPALPQLAEEQLNSANSTPAVSEADQPPPDFTTASAEVTHSGGATQKPSAALNPALPPPKDPTLSWFLFLLKYEFYIWKTLFFAIFISIWAVVIHRGSAGFHSVTVRDTYRALAVAPFGAWVRWGLSKVPQLKAQWPVMNPQTLAANLLAVIVECCLLVFAAGNSWTVGLNDGFNGSCSTVSTFFGELHSLYFEKGPYVSIRYGMTTFVLSICIIQILRKGEADGSN